MSESNLSTISKTEIFFLGTDDKVNSVIVEPGDTVLSALLNSGFDIPNGCRTGICQSCILKTESTNIPAEAQRGLSESQKQQGYFLSCCAIPNDNMSISHTNQSNKEKTEVIEKKLLSPSVLRIRIKKVICYRPGQFVTLWKDKQTARSYSIASHPTKDAFIEFHIRIYPNGAFSSWAKDHLQVGDSLYIQGAMGTSFYTSADKQKTLLLAGIGTGLAPLFGIVREALLRRHKDRIVLLLGSRTKDGIYYQKELERLKKHYAQLEVYYSIAEERVQDQYELGNTPDIYHAANLLLPNLKGVRVFLCGGDSFVRKMRKQCFMGGASMSDISSDTFFSFAK